ncbi:hypothetical protein AVEN_188960-1 [Araneus ventricosus]|uniref:Uncharacterized protein n=1 Tax=Araneus ventricosus TaxID=182803 RepID=A0A4Y2IL68_ARAVE|nr:hypothetical protein AVEN_188960-1 [Araneus ventricosus]
MSSCEETHPETRQQRKQQVADKLTFFFRRYGTAVVLENGLHLNAVRCSRHNAKGDPNHYATVCPVTKPFHFRKPRAENFSTWCENIVQDKGYLARLMNILKILHERRHDIIMD